MCCIRYVKNLEDPAVATGLKRSILIPIPKTIALISYAGKVMVKILHARLQHYVNQEFPDIQAGFRKGRGTRDQIANICWIIEKQGNSRKTSTSVSSILLSLWLYGSSLWKVLKEMGIPDHLICLLRNLYAGQGATVRTLYGATDWFRIEKGVWQGCLLSPCLFNLFAEHIMRNARLDELQSGIKVGWRNINNLRYADDTTLREESEEELKSLLMRVKKESERTDLKLKN